MFSYRGSLEVIVYGMSGTWGLWLVSPFWDAFGSTPTFAVMKMLAPAWVWGWVQMLIVAWLIGSSIFEWKRIKRAVLLVMLLLQLLIWSSFLVANFAATAVPTYFGVCLLYAWLRFVNGGET